MQSHSVASEKPAGNSNLNEVLEVQHPEQPSSRFLKRTLVLIFAPLAVTAYYLWIWLYFLKRDSEGPVKYGINNQIWIFYSWFLIGVFGLDWSKHGLIGVEAAMLQTYFWQVPSAAALLMHSESSWSGPGGWIECLTMRLVRRKKGLTHRLWYLLAFLSLLPFVALPLSGLCLELSDGYVPASDSPMVVGHTWEDFNRRQSAYYSAALSGWKIGSPATVPGIGIIYTPGYLNRENYSSLAHIPNTLPLDEGIPEIFLTPQAKNPISGRAWGFHAGYNCSIVKDSSEFTILNKKSSSTVYNLGYTDQEWGSLITSSGERISIFNSSIIADGNNLWGYAEVGVRNTATVSNPSTNQPIPYYDGTEPGFSESDDPSKADILEYALWQVRLPGSYGEQAFNSTLDPIIKGMGQPFIQTANGSYVRNNTFFKVQSNDGYNSSAIEIFGDPSRLYSIVSLAPPIGVRCQIISVLGTAELNPVQSTFHSFERTPSPPFDQSVEKSQTPRFGVITRATILGRYLEIFTSSNSPAPMTVSNSYFYQNYIQPQTLQKSIMLAHAMDALQLMYDGTYGFEGAWLNTNLTSSKPGKLLTTGVVLPAIPAVLFMIWAVCCALLGVFFGFRRRWSDCLDGYSFFRLGVDSADDVKEKPGTLRAKEFYENEALFSLQALVRDM
ncbi:hypothetical protein B7463_g5464, partial [Scytalidium lignicola]